jgi:hypothetical protein
MDKTFLVKFTVDEAKIEDESNITALFGISDERKDYLLKHAGECQKASAERGEECFNSARAFLDFIENETLEGNEVLFLMYLGYMNAFNAQRMMFQGSKLGALLGMLGGE